MITVDQAADLLPGGHRSPETQSVSSKVDGLSGLSHELSASVSIRYATEPAHNSIARRLSACFCDLLRETSQASSSGVKKAPAFLLTILTQVLDFSDTVEHCFE